MENDKEAQEDFEVEATYIKVSARVRPLLKSEEDQNEII